MSAAELSRDPLDMDGKAFNVEVFMESMMQGDGMSALLKRTRGIHSEVATLDSDLHMLVYENYSKFLSATDTIRNMKNNVDSMKGEREELATTIAKISEGSNRINASLSSHRSKIDKLSGVRRLLTKLHFLLELPRRAPPRLPSHTRCLRA